MPKKPKPIPAVPFDVLIKGHEGVIRLGPGYDLAISLNRTLAKEQKSEVIIAINYLAQRLL